MLLWGLTDAFSSLEMAFILGLRFLALGEQDVGGFQQLLLPPVQMISYFARSAESLERFATTDRLYGDLGLGLGLWLRPLLMGVSPFSEAVYCLTD